MTLQVDDISSCVCSRANVIRPQPRVKPLRNNCGSRRMTMSWNEFRIDTLRCYTEHITAVFQEVIVPRHEYSPENPFAGGWRSGQLRASISSLRCRFDPCTLLPDSLWRIFTNSSVEKINSLLLYYLSIAAFSDFISRSSLSPDTPSRSLTSASHHLAAHGTANPHRMDSPPSA